MKMNRCFPLQVRVIKSLQGSSIAESMSSKESRIMALYLLQSYVIITALSPFFLFSVFVSSYKSKNQQFVVQWLLHNNKCFYAMRTIRFSKISFNILKYHIQVQAMFVTISRYCKKKSDVLNSNVMKKINIMKENPIYWNNSNIFNWKPIYS